MIPVKIDPEAVELLKTKNRSILTVDVRKSGGG